MKEKFNRHIEKRKKKCERKREAGRGKGETYRMCEMEKEREMGGGGGETHRMCEMEREREGRGDT